MKTREPEEGRRYLRIKDLMRRYGCSRGHIVNLAKTGGLPPPMTVNGIQCWPVPVIEGLDRRHEEAYYAQLKAQGFEVPVETVAG